MNTMNWNGAGQQVQKQEANGYQELDVNGYQQQQQLYQQQQPLPPQQAYQQPQQQQETEQTAPASQIQPGDSGKGFAVRVRGIPFQESEYTVYQWLAERGVNVRNGPLGIQFHYTGKQWSGDAYVALESSRDVDTCVAHNNAQMNHRYLEFFPITYAEMERQLKITGLYRFPNEYNIRLRGLEYKCTREAIYSFFPGLDIAAGMDGIIICTNDEGRSSGEGFVLFENKASVIQAIQKHKEKMGERYIEIFLASCAQILESGRVGRDERETGSGFPEGTYPVDAPGGAVPLPAYAEPMRAGYPPGKYPGAPTGWGDDRRSPAMDPYRGGDRRSEPRVHAPPLGQHRLFMRGLPWKCTEVEIQQFFAPTPVRSVTKNLTPTNVFDGSAWVEFPTAESMDEGKKKDRSNMGHRYVELFTIAEHEAQRPKTGDRSGDRGGRGGARRPDRNERPRQRSRSRERSYGREPAPYQNYGGYPSPAPSYRNGSQPRSDGYGYGQGYASQAPAQPQYAQYPPAPQQSLYGAQQPAAYSRPGADNGWN